MPYVINFESCSLHYKTAVENARLGRFSQFSTGLIITPLKVEKMELSDVVARNPRSFIAAVSCDNITKCHNMHSEHAYDRPGTV